MADVRIEIGPELDQHRQLIVAYLVAGRNGECPVWYRTLEIARSLGMSALELEHRFALEHSDFKMGSLEDWMNRAVAAQFAELEAVKIVEGIARTRRKELEQRAARGQSLAAAVDRKLRT